MGSENHFFSGSGAICSLLAKKRRFFAKSEQIAPEGGQKGVKNDPFLGSFLDPLFDTFWNYTRRLDGFLGNGRPKAHPKLTPFLSQISHPGGMVHCVVVHSVKSRIWPKKSCVKKNHVFFRTLKKLPNRYYGEKPLFWGVWKKFSRTRDDFGKKPKKTEKFEWGENDPFFIPLFLVIFREHLLQKRVKKRKCKKCEKP